MFQDEIIGIWSFTEDNMTIYYKFNQNKTGEFFVPNVFNCPFMYKIDDTKLTITMEEREPVSAPYRIDGNKLIVCEGLANQRIYVKND